MYGEEVEDGTAYDDTEKDYIRRAYREYVSTIENSDLFDEGKSWDYYITSYFELMLIEQLEAQLIQVRTDLLEEELIKEIGSADLTADEIKNSELFNELETRYYNLQNAQGQQFEANIEANITQIEGLSETTYLLYNAAQGQYGFVRHILFQFSDAQTMKLNEFKAQDLEDTVKTQMRTQLAGQISIKDLREPNEETGFEGPDESAVWSDISGFMTFFRTAFGGVDTNLDNTYAGDYKDTVIDASIYRATAYPNYVSPSEEAALEGDKVVSTEDIALIKDKFIDFEYAYSDDTASLGSTTNMLLNANTDPFLSNQTYVTEFSEASRNVINAGIGTYTVVVTDFGIHLIMCVDKIEPQSDPVAGFAFNEDLAVKVIQAAASIDGVTLTAEEENSAIYKIFTVLKDEKVTADNSDYNVQIVKDYEAANKIVRNTAVLNELLNQLS